MPTPATLAFWWNGKTIFSIAYACNTVSALDFATFATNGGSDRTINFSKVTLGVG